jgi:ubiquinone/menaquinone biosynthesis C-methylase UbiE
MPASQSETSFLPEIIAYYQQGKEAQRLLQGIGQLEFTRTQDIMRRYLPEPPGVICDIGGGPGLYACWLARLGYEVHLVDAIPLHIQQAQEASLLQPAHPLASVTLGDARHLERADGSVDVVLLLGPLYHLTERTDRVAALREASRILRPGGVLLAAAISRFASALDGLVDGSLEDPAFVEIVKQDIHSGQHRNPHPDRDYFTTAYLHHPLELQAEVAEAGFKDYAVLAIEGPGWLLQDFAQRWQDGKRRETLLMILRALEGEPTLMGASCHFMAVAHRELP